MPEEILLKPEPGSKEDPDIPAWCAQEGQPRTAYPYFSESGQMELLEEIIKLDASHNAAGILFPVKKTATDAPAACHKTGIGMFAFD